MRMMCGRSRARSSDGKRLAGCCCPNLGFKNDLASLTLTVTIRVFEGKMFLLHGFMRSHMSSSGEKVDKTDMLTMFKKLSNMYEMILEFIEILNTWKMRKIREIIPSPKNMFQRKRLPLEKNTKTVVWVHVFAGGDHCSFHDRDIFQRTLVGCERHNESNMERPVGFDG